MKYTSLLISVALLGTVFASCQKVEEEQQLPNEKPIAEKEWTLTVKAKKGLATKALISGEQSLTAEWAQGEKVDVYYNGSLLGTLTAEESGATSTLSGTVNADALPENPDLLTLRFPSKEAANESDYVWSYLRQNGSLETVASNYDYAVASLTNISVDTDNKEITISDEDVEFSNEQSIYRFSFKNAPSSVKFITIFSAKERLVGSRSITNNVWGSNYASLTVTPSSVGEYYVAIRNENTESNDTYTFSVVDNDNALYESNGKSIPEEVLSNGNFISARNIRLNQKTFTLSSSDEIKKGNDVI